MRRLNGAEVIGGFGGETDDIVCDEDSSSEADTSTWSEVGMLLCLSGKKSDSSLVRVRGQQPVHMRVKENCEVGVALMKTKNSKTCSF